MAVDVWPTANDNGALVRGHESPCSSQSPARARALSRPVPLLHDLSALLRLAARACWHTG